MSESEEISKMNEQPKPKEGVNKTRKLHFGGVPYFLLITIATVSMLVIVFSVWGSFSKLRQFDEDVLAKTNTRNDLKTKIDELRISLDGMGEQRDKLVILQKQSKSVQADIEDLTRQKTKLMNENAESSVKITTQSKSLEDLLSRIQQYKAEVRLKQDILSKLGSDQAKVDAKVNELRAIEKRALEKADQAERHLREQRQSLDDVLRQIDLEKMAKTTLENEVAKSRQELSSNKGELAGLRGEIKSADNELSSYMSRKLSRQSQAESIQQEQMKIQKELADAVSKRDIAKADLNNIKEDLSNKRAESSYLLSAVNDLKQQEQALLGVKSDLVRERDKLTKVAAELESGRIEWKNVTASLIDANAEQQNTSTQLRLKISELRNVKSQIDAQKAILVSLPKELELASNDLAQERASLASTTRKKLSAEALLSSLSVQISELKSEMARQNFDEKQAKEIRNELIVLRAERSSLQAEMLNLMSTKKKLYEGAVTGQ